MSLRCDRELWMNRYLVNLNRIEFLVTMACTGRCKHCSEGEHAAAGAHMDAEIAQQAVEAICARHHISSLMTFGGEPLLYPEVVCRIHAAATKMNIPNRQLITNGFFTRDKNRMDEVARMLAESGVQDVLLSVDAFHLETIPIAQVKHFAMATVAADVPIRTHPAWLVSEADDNPYNLRTREILEQFRLLGIHASSGNVIFPSGNAKKYLADYFNPHADNKSPYEEDPEDVRAICFSPNGDVLNGNVYHESILDILDAYAGHK